MEKRLNTRYSKVGKFKLTTGRNGKLGKTVTVAKSVKQARNFGPYDKVSGYGQLQNLFTAALRSSVPRKLIYSAYISNDLPLSLHLVLHFKSAWIRDHININNMSNNCRDRHGSGILLCRTFLSVPFALASFFKMVCLTSFSHFYYFFSKKSLTECKLMNLIFT